MNDNEALVQRIADIIEDAAIRIWPGGQAAVRNPYTVARDILDALDEVSS